MKISQKYEKYDIFNMCAAKEARRTVQAYCVPPRRAPGARSKPSSTSRTRRVFFWQEGNREVQQLVGQELMERRLMSSADRALGSKSPSLPGPRTDEFHKMADHCVRMQQLGKDKDAAKLSLLRKVIAIGGVANAHALFRAECVGKLASMLAWFYGSSPQYCAQLEQAASVCEVGSLLFSSWNPSAHHGDSFRCAIQAEAAALLLESDGSPLMETAWHITTAMNEHFDGSGVPRGIQGEEIPVEARIVAVVSSFDKCAKAETRHGAIHANEACAYFRRESAKRFDPRLVDILLSEWAAFMALREAVHRSPLRRLLVAYGGGGVLGLQELVRLTREK
jgi:response regulator RpfG family c-di-GMP phosphodiesterase